MNKYFSKSRLISLLIAYSIAECIVIGWIYTDTVDHGFHVIFIPVLLALYPMTFRIIIMIRTLYYLLSANEQIKINEIGFIDKRFTKHVIPWDAIEEIYFDDSTILSSHYNHVVVKLKWTNKVFDFKPTLLKRLCFFYREVHSAIYLNNSFKNEVRELIERFELSRKEGVKVV